MFRRNSTHDEDLQNEEDTAISVNLTRFLTKRRSKLWFSKLKGMTLEKGKHLNFFHFDIPPFILCQVSVCWTASICLLLFYKLRIFLLRNLNACNEWYKGGCNIGLHCLEWAKNIQGYIVTKRYKVALHCILIVLHQLILVVFCLFALYELIYFMFRLDWKGKHSKFMRNQLVGTLLLI